MEILDAIDRLDDHVHMAPEVPLTLSVRMDAELLRASVGVIRQHADRTWGSDRAGPVGELFAAVEELESFAAAAKPVPLTNQVRFDRDKLYDRLDRVRELLPQAATSGVSSPWAPVAQRVEEIDALMDDAGHAPFSRALKIDAGKLREAAGRLRTTALQNLGPSDGHAGPLFSLYAALDELDALAHGEGVLKIPHGVLFDLVQRMRAAALDAMHD